MIWFRFERRSVRREHAPAAPRRERRFSLAGGASLAWLLLCATVAVAVPGSLDVTSTNLELRLLPPLSRSASAFYPLGTDEIGRDLFGRLALALQTSLRIAIVGSLVGAVVGTSLGLFAAAAKGWIEDTILAAVDLQAALPFFVLCMAVIAMFGGASVPLVLLVGLFGWERYARVTRARALVLRSAPFVTAASGFGAGSLHIYVRHILPNLIGTLLITFTLTVPEILLLESTLSFLGIGVQPPQASLGSILRDGRPYLASAWWLLGLPGLIIFVTALSISLHAERLRLKLDPASSRRS